MSLVSSFSEYESKESHKIKKVCIIVHILASVSWQSCRHSSTVATPPTVSRRLSSWMAQASPSLAHVTGDSLDAKVA